MNQIKKVGDDYIVEPSEDKFQSELKMYKAEQLMYEAKNENIDKQQFSISDAYHKLATNDKILPSSTQHNLQCQLKENPAQKLARIQKELKDFKDQMIYISEKEKINSDNKLIKQIETIEEEMGNISQIESFQNILDEKTKDEYSLQNNLQLLKTDIQKNISSNMLKKIQTLQQVKSQDDKNSLKVELYIDKDIAKLEDAAHYIKLEQRIQNLEKTLGKVDKGDNDLADRVQNIQSSLKILDSSTLDAVTKRVKALAEDLEAAHLKKKDSQNEDSQKLEEIYSDFSKVFNVVDELPTLVEKLDSLKKVHEDSAGAMINMNNLILQHNTISDQINSNKNLLNKSQDSYKESFETVKNNIKNIDERLKKLSK